MPDPLPAIIENKHNAIIDYRKKLEEYVDTKGIGIPINVDNNGHVVKLYRLFVDLFYIWDFGYFFQTDPTDMFQGFWKTAYDRTIKHEFLREDVWSNVIQQELDRVLEKYSQLKSRSNAWEIPMNGIMSVHIKAEYGICKNTHGHSDEQFSEYLEKLQEQKEIVPELSTEWVNWYDNPYLTYSAFRRLNDINPKPNPYNPNDPYGRNKVPIQSGGDGSGA